MKRYTDGKLLSRIIMGAVGQVKNQTRRPTTTYYGMAMDTGHRQTHGERTPAYHVVLGAN